MRFWHLLAILVTALISGCASLHQTDLQVYKRVSGETLEKWVSVQEAALLHWPYAWSAVAAYQDADDPKRKLLDTSQCPEPHSFLSAQGWILWDSLPLLRNNEAKLTASMQDAAKRMRDAHLRAEVWSNKDRKEVIVAFGGTAATSWEDWKSNMHWVLGPLGVRDEYDVVTDTFLPAFLMEFKKRSESSDFAWLKTARLVPTGHSLGGGLAQRFTYSAWFESQLPRPTEVFLFDPSPVSGKRSTKEFVQHSQHDHPFKGLKIYRIYKRGEILASVRSLLHFGNPNPDGNEQGQNWIDIRYKDNWTWRTLLPSGSVHAHGMYDLACFMKQHLPPSMQ